jgi:cell division protein FtsB
LTNPDSLESLSQRRAEIADQIADLGDLRCGSITPTSGRCGKPNCHCHQPGDPGHGPNLRLTFKVQGKTATVSLPTPAAILKAQREIEEFRKYQALHKEFLEINAHICQLRPESPDTLSEQEKKRSNPSSKRPPPR